MFRKSTILLLASLILALAAAGCAPAAPAPVPSPTKTPKPTFTPTPDWTPTAMPFNTVAPAPTEVPPTAEATAEPTEEPTPEATATPDVTQLTANQNVNVRTGPGTAYPAIGQLTAGQSFEVTGRNSAGDWVKFDFNGRDGWVTATLVSVAGNLDAVAIAQAPALPTARPRPTAAPQPVQPTAAPAPVQPPAPQYPFQYVQGSANCQPNAGTTYFNGQVKYKSGDLRNGVCVHIAFYGPRQTKGSGYGGVGNGNWGFSPFGAGPGPAGTVVEIFVVSCEGVPVGGQDVSSGFGDLTPKSDKWVHTLSGGEQCTGITFVGDN